MAALTALAPAQLNRLRTATVAPGPAKASKPLQVCQARIANVEVPNNKCIRYSLQYIYGVGDPTAQKILAATSIDPAKRTYQLAEEELASIRDELEKYTTEGDLRRIVSMNIKRLKEIQCYRGRRHYMSLPTRGQKSKTNAKTAKRMLK